MLEKDSSVDPYLFVGGVHSVTTYLRGSRKAVGAAGN